MSNIISGCGKTEEECFAFYTQQKMCPRFAILDSRAVDMLESSNCVHHSNWVEQLIKEHDQEDEDESEPIIL